MATTFLQTSRRYYYTFLLIWAVVVDQGHAFLVPLLKPHDAAVVVAGRYSSLHLLWPSKSTTSSFSRRTTTNILSKSRSFSGVCHYNQEPNKNQQLRKDPFFSRKSLILFESSSSSSSGSTSKTISPVLQEASRLLKRTSWFSWWVQTILSVISCTILLFAANASQANKAANPPSFFLSALGLTVSALSIIWTWGNGTRLSRRLLRDPVLGGNSNANNTNNANLKLPSLLPAAPWQLLRRAIRVQLSLNLIGLFLTLIAAEEIVGSLALKVLTAGNTMYGVTGGAAAAGAVGWVQPLDILVVQANTNTLLSHFASLSCSLYLADRFGIFRGRENQQQSQSPEKPAKQR